MGRIGLDLLIDDAAIEDVNRAIGVASEAGIMSHHDDRRATIMQFLEELHHGITVFGIEITRGLVRRVCRRARELRRRAVVDHRRAAMGDGSRDAPYPLFQVLR